MYEFMAEHFRHALERQCCEDEDLAGAKDGGGPILLTLIIRHFVDEPNAPWALSRMVPKLEPRQSLHASPTYASTTPNVTAIA